MARPKKERVICAMPRFLDFSPTTGKSGDTQVLCFDEYEVIRLHDLEHFPQEETARQMLISRPTVTELLASAHEKLARMLVEGTGLELRGLRNRQKLFQIRGNRLPQAALLQGLLSGTLSKSKRKLLCRKETKS